MYKFVLFVRVYRVSTSLVLLWCYVFFELWLPCLSTRRCNVHIVELKVFVVTELLSWDHNCHHFLSFYWTQEAVEWMKPFSQGYVVVPPRKPNYQHASSKSWSKCVEMFDSLFVAWQPNGPHSSSAVVTPSPGRRIHRFTTVVGVWR